MRTPSRVRSSIALATITVLMACGTAPADPPPPPPPPPPPAGIRIVSGGAVADTIGAAIASPIVIEVRGPGGAVAVGAPVVLDAVDPSGWLPFFLVPRANVFKAVDTIPTDATGRVQTGVLLGGRTWSAWLRIGVPSLGFRDSTTVTVRPGNLASLVVTPADTALLTGNGYQLAAAGRDRGGNPVAGAASYAVESGPITVTTAGRVTGTAIGRAAVRATIGSTGATAQVSVVPEGQYSALAFDGATQGAGQLVTFRSDGANYQVRAPLVGSWLSGPPMMGPWPVWLPDGRIAVRADAAIDLVDASGAVQRIASGSPLYPSLGPQPTRDGQWIYFSRGSWGFGTALWRVHPDGSGLVAVEDTSAFAGFQGGGSPSPDGSRVVYQTSDWFGGELRILEVATKRSIRLGVQGAWAVWSPDGSLIAFLDPDAAIRVIRPDGTGNRVLLERSWVNPGFSWSPDGKYLLALAPGDIWPRPVIIDVATLAQLPLAFAPGGKALLQLSWRP